jgi:hypothetical protein
MSFRRLLTTTCVLALCATPALPQTAPAPASADSFASSLPELSMRETLRAFGLNRPTRDFQFVKGEASNTRAVFTTLVSIGSDGKRTTLDNLVITRSDLVGPTLGQYSVSADKFADADGKTIGHISVTGLRGTSNILDALKVAARSTIGQEGQNGGAPTAYAESIAFRDLAATTPSADGTTAFKVAAMALSRVSFNKQLTSFDRFSLTNMTLNSKSMDATIAGMEYSGIDPKVFSRFFSDAPFKANAADLLTFTLGHAEMTGLSYRFKDQSGLRFRSTNNTSPDFSPATASFGRISIDNVKDGFIGQFNIADFKVGGGVGAKAWEFELGRLGLGGINMAYFSEVSKGFIEAVNVEMAKAAPATTASPSPATTPAITAAIVAPSGPPVMLKTILKGGPLDGGMRELTLGGLKVSAAGFDFSIDQIGMNQVRNRDDIVTRVTTIPTKARFSWPEPTGRSNPMTALSASFGGNSIEMGISATATFAPETDRLTYQDYVIDLVGWGKLKMDFTISGMDRMMAQTSISDFTKATTLPLSAPPPAPTTAGPTTPSSTSKPPTPPTRPAKPFEPLKKLIAIFGNVTFDSGRLAIEDSGGIDKAARIFVSMPGNNPSSRPVITPQQIRAIRDSWTVPLRQMSGNKDQPVLLRQLSVNAARWLESGGTFVATSAPATPLQISRLTNPSAITPETWGLSFASQPAAVPPRR